MKMGQINLWPENSWGGFRLRLWDYESDEDPFEDKGDVKFTKRATKIKFEKLSPVDHSKTDYQTSGRIST